jgi:hypothetical protein
MKLLATALLLVLSAQDKVELRWKWQKGQELVYKSTQKTLLEFGGAPMDQSMGYTYSMTVLELSDTGEATIQVKYLAVATKGIGPGGEYEYDSEKDKEAPAEGPAAMQARMVGQSFTMKMNAIGRVTDVKGYDKVLDAMMKAGDDNPALKGQLKQMFNNDTFKGMMQQMAPPLPEEKVGKGDGWDNNFVVKMPMIGGMTFAIKAKLAEVQDNNAKIEQDIKVDLKGDDNKDNPLAGLVEIKDGKGKATAIFSLEKGCFVSQKSTMEMKIAIKGNEMPMKTVVELKLLPKK